MDKKTSIAVAISIIVILVMVGGAGLVNNFIGSNNNKNEMIQENNKISQVDQKDLTIGTGDIAVAGKIVTVHYTGVFADGKKFDSSRDRGVPFEFTLGAGMVIKGWDVGVEGMKVGGKRLLVIPPDFAYGPNDYGPIPGNSTLIFEVELLGVK
ncbi:MAG: FKBP-type peptidyl-prolyl cis-trans isomerase [Candidatus Pacebacteria bacterium]|nr:FKBP-type peptidyl-prolyl cis-trans isomerase [Candidatus Paceibacterota bacterium]